MAWAVLTWKILRIFQSQFLFKEVCAETRHSSYTNKLAVSFISKSLILKRKIKILTFIVTSFSFWSCGDCVNYNKVGEYQISQKTLDIVNYEENDTIRFLNNKNEEIKLSISKSINKIDTVIVREIQSSTDCNSAYEYIRTEKINYGFQDDRLIVMQFQLTIGIEKPVNSDSIVVFESLNIYYSNYINQKFELFRFDILTNEITNSVSAEYKEAVLNEAKYTGDTIISGVNYFEIYEFENENGSKFYFDKEFGPIYIDFGDNKYWKLVE